MSCLERCPQFKSVLIEREVERGSTVSAVVMVSVVGNYISGNPLLMKTLAKMKHSVRKVLRVSFNQRHCTCSHFQNHYDVIIM